MHKKTPVFFILMLLALSTAFAEFKDCSFNFGRQWVEGATLAKLNHVAIWLGDNETYNNYWEGKMLSAASDNNVTPVFYAYVIAEYGKDHGLKDCDMGSPNHCTGGAKMIRNNWGAIIARYSSYAKGIKDNYGTSKPTIWLIEPDFVQYSVTGDSKSSHNQEGGGIPDADLAGKYFNEIVSTIKAQLPNAKIAVDISPWFNNDLKTWYNLFDKSKINFAFTSGGRTQGNNARIRSDNNNNVTWANVYSWLGKKIIADDGYGVGGASNSDYAEWLNVSNLNSRIADGVVALTIQEPVSSYYDFSASNSNLNTCGSNPPPSSSSVVVPPSSSSVVKPSSSSVVVPPSSSSVVKPSSSSVVPPSSSSVSPSATWTPTNTVISNGTVSGVSIGQSTDWGKERVVSRTLFTVQSGVSYTLSFNVDVSRGGAAMDMDVALSSYCTEVFKISNAVGGSSYSCQFTATKTEAVTLKLSIPAERWETVTISNLKLMGPNGDVLPINRVAPLAAREISVLLRNGRVLNWNVQNGSVFQVFDVNGHKVYQTQNVDLDLSKLPAGLYIIRSINGSKVQFKRLNNF